MIAAFKAELVKIRTTRTIWGLLGGMVLLTVVGTVAMLIVLDRQGRSLADAATLREAMHAANTGRMFVLVAGIVAVAGEFRDSQITTTLLAVPRRGRVAFAKVGVFTALGVGFGTIAAVVTFAIAHHSGLPGAPASLGDPTVWRAMVGAIGSAGLFGALGVGLGALVRNLFPAVVGALAWLLIVESILLAASSSIGRLLPGSAASALAYVPAKGLLSMGGGALVLGAWVVAFVVAGAVVFERRDVG